MKEVEAVPAVLGVDEFIGRGNGAEGCQDGWGVTAGEGVVADY